MKNLKIGMIALLMIVGNFIFAQNHQPKPATERATERSNNLKEKLGLNADQQKSVYDLCLQRAQQEDADRAKLQGNREAMQAARKQNEQNFESKLFQVITPDQKAKFEQMKQQRMEKMEKGGGMRGQE